MRENVIHCFWKIGGRSLVQSGVPHDVIQIRGSRLLVRNKLYGQVSSCGSDLLFSCQKSRSVVNDSAVEISSAIVPITTPQLSQPQVETSVALNVNGCSASSQDQSSTLPLYFPPQSSSTTPVSSQWLYPTALNLLIKIHAVSLVNSPISNRISTLLRMTLSASQGLGFLLMSMIYNEILPNKFTIYKA